MTRAERAEASARAARERAARLQAVTAALARAASATEVGRAAVREGLLPAGAAVAMLAAFPRPGQGSDAAAAAADHLELLAAEGVEAEDPDWRRIPLSAHRPIAEAARTGAAVWLASPDEAGRRYPAAPLGPAAGAGAIVALPLVSRAVGEGRVVGALGAAFPVGHRLDADERAYFETLAGLTAQALERAWLYDDEQAARRQAEAANLAKAQFLATMSHELRTPLNAIQGHVQLLELGIHGPVNDAQRDALSRVDRAQRHLLSLIEDVLSYARLESGRVEYDMHPVRVDDVVRDVLAMVEPQLRAKGMTLAVLEEATDDERALEVWADREKLTQVLLNLLSNAVKFTAAGGRAWVELVRRGDLSDPPDLAYLRVRDSGIGIPRDKLDTIFEPFVQLKAPYLPGQGGTGLGLAISRDLARGMGGDVRGRSFEGEGSSFTVVLRRVKRGA